MELGHLGEQLRADPFLRPVLEGSAAWDAERDAGRAIEIRDGRVVNPAILAFQGRCGEPPYAVV